MLMQMFLDILLQDCVFIKEMLREVSFKVLYLIAS